MDREPNSVIQSSFATQYNEILNQIKVGRKWEEEIKSSGGDQYHIAQESDRLKIFVKDLLPV